jgi:predicted RNase H-like HicB family nuclease
MARYAGLIRLLSRRSLGLRRHMRTFHVVVERDPDTGLLVGYVPGWPGAHSQGESLDELQRNLEEVVTMLLEDGEPKLESEFVGVRTIKVAWWAPCPHSNRGKWLPSRNALVSSKRGRKDRTSSSATPMAA